MHSRLIKHIFIGSFGYKCYLFLVMLFLQVPAIPDSSFVWLPGLPTLQAVPDSLPAETYYLTTRSLKTIVLSSCFGCLTPFIQNPS